MSTAPSVTRGHVSPNRSISIIAVEVVTGHIATKLFSKALVQNRCVLGLVGKPVVYMYVHGIMRWVCFSLPTGRRFIVVCIHGMCKEW